MSDTQRFDPQVPEAYAPLLDNLWNYAQRALLLPVAPHDPYVTLRSTWEQVMRVHHQPALTTHQALAFQVAFRGCFGGQAPSVPMSFSAFGHPAVSRILRLDLYLSHRRAWTYADDHATLTVEGKRLFPHLSIPSSTA